MIASAYGCKIKISFFFAAVVTLALILDKTNTSVITLCAAVFHEGGHLLCLIWFGEKPTLICLEPFGMKIKRSGNLGMSLARETAVALSGPAANIILALTLILLKEFCGVSGVKKAIAVNLSLAFFNLLPIQPLDAGRALLNLLCIKTDILMAQRIVTVIGIIVLFPVAVAGIYVLIKSKYNITLLLASIYLAVLLIKE